MKTTIPLLAMLCFTSMASAQNVAINSSGAAANSSAMLDVASTTKGMLIPRMTEAQRIIIAAPVAGLLVYQTDIEDGFYFYDGSQWIPLSTKETGWNLGGNDGTNSATDYIGTSDAQPLIFSTDGFSRYEISASGRLRSIVGGSVSLPTYSWFESPTTGLFQPALNTMAFSTSGLERIRFFAGGQISINSTSVFTGTVLNTFAFASDNAFAAQSALGRAGYFQSTGTGSVTPTVSSFQGSTSTNTSAASILGQSASSRSGVFLASLPNTNTIALTGQYNGGGTFDAIGVYGRTNSSSAFPGWGYGVFGEGNYYGVFADGDIGASGGKFFEIDHPLDPENKILRHACMESNEILTHYRGTIQLDAAGTAVVELPTYFETLNINFSYHLTPVGAPGPNLYISSEINNNQFEISGGQPGAKVSWMVEAERNDKYMQTHANRKNMEFEKKDYMKGKYLDPGSWGQPEERGVNYGRINEAITPERTENPDEK